MTRRLLDEQDKVLRSYLNSRRNTPGDRVGRRKRDTQRDREEGNIGCVHSLFFGLWRVCWGTFDSRVPKDPFKDQSFGDSDNAYTKADKWPAAGGTLQAKEEVARGPGRGDSENTVCVSLFYVNDIASTGSRGRTVGIPCVYASP
jgi:hypothetical protein